MTTTPLSSTQPEASVPDITLQPISSPTLSHRMSQLFQWAIARLTKSSEPVIKLEHDGAGNIYWYVYDPISGESGYMTSETDVLRWLDQLRYV